MLQKFPDPNTKINSATELTVIKSIPHYQCQCGIDFMLCQFRCGIDFTIVNSAAELISFLSEASNSAFPV